MPLTRTAWLLLVLVSLVLASCRESDTVEIVLNHFECRTPSPLVIRGECLRFAREAENWDFWIENTSGNDLIYTEMFKAGDAAYYANSLPVEAFALSFYSFNYPNITGRPETDYPYATPLIGLIVNENRISGLCFVEEYTIETLTAGVYLPKFSELEILTKAVDQDYELRETIINKATYHVHKRDSTENLIVLGSPEMEDENYLLIEMEIDEKMIDLTPRQRDAIRFFYVIDLNTRRDTEGSLEPLGPRGPFNANASWME